jgi:DNA-binding response OmpR family regulator
MQLVRTTEFNVVMKPNTPSRPAAARPVRKTMAVPVQLRVLMVEDIPTVALTMRAALLQAGMEVEVVATGAEALTAKDRFRPDIALVDLELPDMNGITLVEAFARDGDLGVIVVTANDEIGMRVAGLDTGADDYIVKPVSGRELVARIQAVHRRMSKPPAARRLRIFVDHTQRVLIGNSGARTLLTEAELAALDTMLEANGASVSREWLSKVALKRPLHSEDRAVDQLVMKLRRKLTEHDASPRVILSARRQGYVIADPSLFRVLPALVPADALVEGDDAAG